MTEMKEQTKAGATELSEESLEKARGGGFKANDPRLGVTTNKKAESFLEHKDGVGS